jgi:hypothetical protein
MAKRGIEPGYLISCSQGNRLIKTCCFIEKDHDKFLTTASASTGKEISLLVNEAIEDFIRKNNVLADISIHISKSSQ